MKKKFAIILLFFNLTIYSQIPHTVDSILTVKGEIYFSFKNTDKKIISQITKIISIDHLRDSLIYAYANKKEFIQFLSFNIPFSILHHPGDIPLYPKLKASSNWDFYPTFQEYDSIIHSYQTNFPELCKVSSIGKSVNGRELYVIKISDQVETEEDEPNFLFSSTIHGDEKTGFILLLRMIDYLVNQYDSSTRIKKLLNNTQIWINPLYNPDGCYKINDTVTNSSVRYNANNVDLNRNFPDAVLGNFPDGYPLQPENEAIIKLMKSRYYVFSAMFHGGVEVINYPWDVFKELHSDDDWYKYISRKYVDTVHIYKSNYMTYLNNGITNGYDWYQVFGCRQDYVNYFLNSREVTIEVSNAKSPDPWLLPNFWNYNYRSILNLIEQSTYGITGKITDSITGKALKAKISIKNHDTTNSHIYSDSLTGNYRRLIYKGSYNVTFSLDGYNPKTSTITINNEEQVILNVQLNQKQKTTDKELNEFSFLPNPNDKNNWDLYFKTDYLGFLIINIYDITGKQFYAFKNDISDKGFYYKKINLSNLPKGLFIIRIDYCGKTYKQKFLKY